MDSMDQSGLQEVRKIIESSTSKVSLRDLEKKGFRKVKVLRSNDIDELIRRAVTAVVAREPSDEGRVSEELIQRSKEELKRLMAQTRQIEQERAELIAQNEALEARLREAARLQEVVKELQRRLADEQEARKRAEAAGGEARVSAAARLEEAERRAHDAELRARSADAARGELEQLQQKVAPMREEVDTLRARVKEVETEKRLVEQLEVPKLRERVAELEGELRVARQAGGGAGAASTDQMRAMFRELLKETGAGGGADAKAISAEFAKLQSSLAEQIARAGGRGERVTDADLAVAKVSLDALFKHDLAAADAVQSNIQDVKFREQTTTSDLKGKLDKLKSLRKGGKSE
jgi:regulator of replication initiation timing